MELEVGKKFKYSYDPQASRSSNDSNETDEQRLHAIYKQRLHDRKRFYTRRRLAIESKPKSMEQLLSQYFSKDPESLSQIEQSRALLAWESFVGETAANASQALRIRSHRLIVQVKDPLWRQQLIFLKSQILRKYRHHFPRLRLIDIYFMA